MKSNFLPFLAVSFIVLTLSSCVAPYYQGVSTYSSVGVGVLPTGYRTVYVGGDPFFFSRNAWYRRSNNRFYRCPAPRGYSNFGRYSRFNNSHRYVSSQRIRQHYSGRNIRHSRNYSNGGHLRNGRSRSCNRGFNRQRF